MWGRDSRSYDVVWSVTNSLRAELESQRTQVLGVHVGFVDTDMVAAIELPKLAPRQVATRVFDALRDGASEVLADDASVRTKAALSGSVDDLTFALAL